jgi:hypothetical protein
MKFIVTSIKFDTDGDKKLAKKLQKEWIGKTFEADNWEDANQRGADIISDQCGWCIFSLNFKREKDELARAKRSKAAKESTPKRLYTLKKNKEKKS